ncbi:MAG: flagellar hook protein FlgE [Mariprofundaceae bacterium]
MGIYNALYTGASGLAAFGEAVRVIGDNIANVNSLGFKSQQVVFSDVLSQTVGVTRSNIANQVGNGTRIGQITRDQQQGSIKNTTNPTDMAINGKGMFALRDPASDGTFYSRAGAFFLDKDFNLIDGQGFVVQGWALDEVTQDATGNVTDITFANLAAAAQATTIINAGVSLDSNAAVIAGSVTDAQGTFNPSDPSTFNYKSEVKVFDSLGAQHPVNVFYVKTAANQWNWYAGVNGLEIDPGVAPPAPPTTADAFGGLTAAGNSTETYISAFGTVAFGDNGNLVAETQNAGTLPFNWLSAAPTTLGFNFGAVDEASLSPLVGTDLQGSQQLGVALPGDGLDGTVQMAGAFATRQMSIDGFASGFLDRLETDSTGRIFGAFTNGQRRPLYQVALASFPNDAVLSHEGNNLQQETISSGSPVMEKPGNGGMGSITPYGLEQSNVDLAAEFVNMIIIQRGYEANSKTILTTDQMLASLMQIKR